MKDGFYASISAQRLLIWLTIALMVLFGAGLFGLMKFVPPPPPDMPAEEVAQLYRASPVAFKIGTILGLIAGACVLPLTLVISVQMARLEKGFPIWSAMQALAGTAGTIFFWLPMLIFATAAFSAERAPELTLLLHEFGWLCFIVPLAYFPMQLLGIIIVSFIKEEEDRVSAFPRWIGYLNIWTLVTSFGGPVAILFKQGIFAWNGLLPFYIPLVLFSVWLPAMSYTCLRALRFQERGESRAAPAMPAAGA